MAPFGKNNPTKVGKNIPTKVGKIVSFVNVVGTPTALMINLARFARAKYLVFSHIYDIFLYFISVTLRSSSANSPWLWFLVARFYRDLAMI